MDPPQPFWLLRLAAAVNKTRTRGRAWLWNRLHDEFHTPTTGPGKFLRAVLAGLEEAFASATGTSSRIASHEDSDRALYFFYDLEVCPITYDIASFMALAELERRRLGLVQIHVIVVPGRRLEREAEDYEAVVGTAARLARLTDIVVPVTKLLPSCKSCTLCESRAQAAALLRARAKHKFPADYVLRFPTHPDGRDLRRRAKQGETVFPVFSAPSSARDAMAAFLEPKARGRRVIVITLREYGYMPARNSNLKSWADFADGLDPRRYAVVFVRDTWRAKDPIPEVLSGHIVCQTASLNVDLRMALYEMAYLNMAIMHGPMELCWYNEACRYLLFLAVGSAPQTEREVLIRTGFEIDRPLSFARAYQRIIWEPDHPHVVRREFEAMEPLLEPPPPISASGANS